MLWTFKTSLDISPLIIDNGTVYPLFQISSQGHILTALDARNGAELWHYAMNVSQSQNVDVQAMQDKIYVSVWTDSQTPNMNLSVLKINDGTQLWHVKAATMQLLQNDLLTITTNDGLLRVLRADNGHEVWHYRNSNSSNLFPITGSDLFYIQMPSGSLQALRADSGALVWTYKDPWGIAQVFPEGNVNGVLYLETGDGFIVALRTSDGKRLWHVRPVSPPYNSDLIQVEDGIVYSFTTIGEAQDETVVALRASDGSILWRRQIGASSNNMLLKHLMVCFLLTLEVLLLYCVHVMAQYSGMRTMYKLLHNMAPVS